eukprot:1904093-Rhodomonas_salina.1
MRIRPWTLQTCPSTHCLPGQTSAERKWTPRDRHRLARTQRVYGSTAQRRKRGAPDLELSKLGGDVDAL